MIVTFLGTKGGTGTTTLAVNSAADVRRYTNRPTLVVDVKTGPGDVAVFLGLRPRYNLVDLIDQLGWSDNTLAARFVTEHASGLHVVAAADAFGRPDSHDAEAVDETLRGFASLYDFVFVDAGSTLNVATAAALNVADIVVLVANPDVPCLRNLQRYGDALKLAGVAPEKVRIALNRTSDTGAMSVSQIEKVLSRTIDYQIASDYRTVAAAVNTGVPVNALRNTDLNMQIDGMARALISPRLAAV
jgi:pilus assembly protein CpaE